MNLLGKITYVMNVYFPIMCICIQVLEGLRMTHMCWKILPILPKLVRECICVTLLYYSLRFCITWCYTIQCRIHSITFLISLRFKIIQMLLLPLHALLLNILNIFLKCTLSCILVHESCRLWKILTIFLRVFERLIQFFGVLILL